MSKYTSGKSKFKALRNIGNTVRKYEIGTFVCDSNPEHLLDNLVIKFEYDEEPWYIEESSMAPNLGDEPAVKYIGDIK